MIAPASRRRIENPPRKSRTKSYSTSETLASVRRWLDTEIEVVGRKRTDADRMSFAELRTLLDELPFQVSQPVNSSVDAPYLTAMLGAELLSPAMETHLFQAMNACKRRARRLQKRLSLAEPDQAVVSELERWMQLALETRNRIVAANVRLVVSVARKFAGTNCSLTDLISDGNLTLLKAVEKFDVSRGFRFSTYATWALRYDYVRSVERNGKAAKRFQAGDEQLDSVADERGDGSRDAHRAAGLAALERMLTFLDPREHAIILRRFGLIPGSAESSLQEISRDLGICKERVRQLQLRAIEKLRTSAGDFVPEQWND